MISLVSNYVSLISLFLAFSLRKEFVFSFTLPSHLMTSSSWRNRNYYDCRSNKLNIHHEKNQNQRIAPPLNARREYYEGYEEEYEDDFRPQRNNAASYRNNPEIKFVGRSVEEEELKNMRYEDEYDDDYDDDDDAEEYDYYDDDDEEEEDNVGIGNFWNNPNGGLDSALRRMNRDADRNRGDERYAPPRRRARGSQR